MIEKLCLKIIHANKALIDLYNSFEEFENVEHIRLVVRHNSLKIESQLEKVLGDINYNIGLLNQVKLAPVKETSAADGRSVEGSRE